MNGGSGSQGGGSEGDRVAEAAAFLQQRLGRDLLASLRLGIVLGSGLKGFAAQVRSPVSVPFAEVPHWPAPRVEGHGAALVVGRVGSCSVACLGGRVHLYEGHTPADVVRAVRTLRLCGVDTFLLTNAAGGIGDQLSAGDLMLIEDHLNLTGCSPLTGPADERLGARFPDQTRVWDPGLRGALRAIDGNLQNGVYAGLLGPSYETPAEVQMLLRLGADAVGMSTVHEAIALNAMRTRLCGISLISNLAAGIAEAPLSHAEVIAAGQQAEARLCTLVASFCARI